MKYNRTKKYELLIWVCGKWGLTEVIEHLLYFCFGGRKPFEYLYVTQHQ